MYEMNRHGDILDKYNVPNEGQIYFNQAFETFDGKLYFLNYESDNCISLTHLWAKSLCSLDVWITMNISK